MTHLTAFETGAGLARKLGSPTTTMREFNAYFITHEIAFMVLSDALFRSVTIYKFLDRGQSIFVQQKQIDFTYNKPKTEPEEVCQSVHRDREIM